MPPKDSAVGASTSFLLTCIKHMEGKINLDKVATELGITKNAANLRLLKIRKNFEKDNGGEDSGAANAPISSTPAGRKRKKPTTSSDGDSETNQPMKMPPAKRKKADQEQSRGRGAEIEDIHEAKDDDTEVKREEVDGGTVVGEEKGEVIG